MIYAHPNAVDIGMAYHELRHVSREATVNVLLFEYSGYGLTNTPITEESIHQDTLSVYYFARRRLNVPTSRLILCGRSIGASPAAFLTASLPPEETPCLLILQCPFSALSECIHEISHNAVSIANVLGYNWFRTIDIIAEVRCPVVLHHGTSDDIVRISHSYKLKEARDTAAQPCVTYLYKEEGRGHNNLSPSILIKILGDRVVSEGLSLLKLQIPRLLVSHPPVYKRLFHDDHGDLFTTIDAAVVHWSARLPLRLCAPPLDHLHLLLTASVCLFSMQAARSWQVYSTLIKQNACGDAVQERCSKEMFLRRCIACWGSPLGIHLGVENGEVQPEVRLFGFGAGRQICFDEPAVYLLDDTQPLLSILEIYITPALLSCMKKCLSTAPELLEVEEVALPCFIHVDIVTAIQVECERSIGLLSAADRARLCSLIDNFEGVYDSLISSKALERCRSLTPTKASHLKGDETFEEFQEWLRPWITTQLDFHSLAPEVPWDYYLLRGRSLARRHALNLDMSWPECRRAMEESEVVRELYQLFLDVSSQCLRPPFC